MFKLDNKVMAASYKREYGIWGWDSGFTKVFKTHFHSFFQSAHAGGISRFKSVLLHCNFQVT